MFSPNDPLLFLFVGIIVAAVLGQSVFFLVKSIRRAQETGMDMTKIKKTIITAAIFTIAPAIAIVITVISLSKSLGIALPWLRLSVVGSLSYEAIAADNAARGMGFNSLAELAGKINASQYVTITIVMTVSIMVGIWLVPVIAKKYQNGLVNFENKDKKWSDILQNSLFIGMISAFVGFVFCDLSRLWSEKARYVTEKDMETGAEVTKEFTSTSGLVPVIVMTVSALSMCICGILINKLKWKWLNDYALPICMVIGMAVAIPVTAWLGMEVK